MAVVSLLILLIVYYFYSYIYLGSYRDLNADKNHFGSFLGHPYHL